MKDISKGNSEGAKNIVIEGSQYRDRAKSLDINPKEPPLTTSLYGGESIQQNQEKSFNESYLAEKELGQQNENN